MRKLLAVLLLATLPAVAHAQAPRVERVKIIERGIYKSEVAKTTAAPGAATGFTATAANIRRVRSTTTIPARVGVEFGIRYRIVGRPANASVKLKLVILTPPSGLRNPATGNTIVRDETEWDRKLGEVGFNSYALDKSWEVVPGVWKFEVWQGDRKLATQRFTLVKR